MIGLTLIFHLLSAVCLVAAVIYFADQKSQLKFHSKLWDSVLKKQTIYIDWPSKFLYKLSTALSAKFYNDSKGDKPCRIEIEPWVKLHGELGVQGIDINQNTITVTTVFASDQLPCWQARLNDSLSNKVNVTIKPGNLTKGDSQ